MYLAHFGLNESPFGITPDTSFFFSTSRYQEALNTLLIAARTGEVFIKITGEVGTGKTLLCRKFMASLGDEFNIAYIHNPNLEPQALLMALTEELGMSINLAAGQHHLLKSINSVLLEFSRQNKRVLICIDEAQAMPLKTMEALRLLTNLETEKSKLLQVVIFGQPELDVKLSHDSMRQLKQRINFDYVLNTLTHDELHSYLNHRLRVAGYQGGRVFSQGALSAMRNKTQGVPRLVNVLAHKSLMLAYGKGRATVERADVMAAAADTSATRSLSWKTWNPIVLVAVSIVGTLAVVWSVIMWTGMVVK